MQTILNSGQAISAEQISPLFKVRDPNGHKGSFGCVAILGGARGMTGAAILAGRAALKIGAGKVILGIAQQPMQISYDSENPELMLRDPDDLLNSDNLVNAWAAGCGLGTSEASMRWLRQLFTHRKQAPMVLDADGLNALACAEVSPTWGRGDVVLTPHPAEAARLLESTTIQVQSDRPAAAQALAHKYKAWIVLKGAGTIICAPDQSWQINTTGNIGLASAGTGDVLSGFLASLLAQGIPIQMAVPSGVWLHGAAADQLARQGIGPIGLTASELAAAARSIRNQGTYPNGL